MKTIAAFLALAGALAAQTITTIAGSDTISASRSTINTNFSNLNTGKMHNAGSWLIGTTYNIQDLVQYNSVSYISLAGANVGHQPDTSALWWVAIGSASSGGGDASTNTSSSSDNQVALASGTGGKTIKFSSFTGLPYLTGGIMGSATFSHIVGLFNSGTCSGYLHSSGSCISGLGTGDVITAGDNVMTGYTNFSAGRISYPDATFASPPSSPLTGQVWLFSDASSTGVCGSGGSAKALCRWTGSTWEPLGLIGAESVSNKSTSTALGTSNTLYPSQNAVKTYVDTGLSGKASSTAATTVNGATCTLGSTCTVADSTKVPTTRTVAGHALSADVTVSASDVGLGNVANVAQVTHTGGAMTADAIPVGNSGADIKASLASIDSSGNISTPGTITGGAGGTEHYNALPQSTHPSIIANAVMRYAPTSVTGYQIQELGAAGTGIPLYTNTSGDMVTTLLSTNGSGNVLRSAGTAAIASGKTATISNTVTFTATDSSTVAFGGGGTVAYTTGSPATNDCAKFDSSGRLVSAGAACGSGSGAPSGTGFVHVTSGVYDTPAELTVANLPGEYYATSTGSSNAYVVAPTNAVTSYVTGEHYRFHASFANTGAATVTFSGVGAKSIVSVVGGITTALAANDIRSGQEVDLIYDGTNMQMVSPLGNAASSSFSASSSDTLTNKTVDAEGTGNSITIPFKFYLPAATCAGTTGTINWDTSATLAPTATCAAGSTETTLILGTADFPDSDGDYQMQFSWMLPSDWTGAVDLKFTWLAAATSGDVIWKASTVCRADAEVRDAAFNTASTVTDTAKGTTLQLNTASITGVTATGCAAGELMTLKVARDRTTSGDTITGVVSLVGVEMTYRRAM